MKGEWWESRGDGRREDEEDIKVEGD